MCDFYVLKSRHLLPIVFRRVQRSDIPVLFDMPVAAFANGQENTHGGGGVKRTEVAGREASQCIRQAEFLGGQSKGAQDLDAGNRRRVVPFGSYHTDVGANQRLLLGTARTGAPPGLLRGQNPAMGHHVRMHDEGG